MEVRVDGQPIEGWGKNVSGRRLTCTAPSGVFIFEIPAGEYQDLEEEMESLDRQQVSMGELPHLIVRGEQHANLELKANVYYDVLAYGPEGVEGGRLSTCEGKPPYALTLEEAKLLAILDVGATLKQAKGVKATIIPMTAWGSTGRFIIVGFSLDEESGRDCKHTIMVDHCGGVQYSHGFPKEDFRHFFGAKPKPPKFLSFLRR